MLDKYYKMIRLHWESCSPTITPSTLTEISNKKPKPMVT